MTDNKNISWQKGSSIFAAFAALSSLPLTILISIDGINAIVVIWTGFLPILLAGLAGGLITPRLLPLVNSWLSAGARGALIMLLAFCIWFASMPIADHLIAFIGNREHQDVPLAAEAIGSYLWSILLRSGVIVSALLGTLAGVFVYVKSK